MQFQRMDDRGDPVGPSPASGNATKKSSRYDRHPNPKAGQSPEIIHHNPSRTGGVTNRHTPPLLPKVTKMCQQHLHDTPMLDIRQSRKGWCQELIGCAANTEFNFYRRSNDSSKVPIANAIEESNCFCRVCCRYVSTNHNKGKRRNKESYLLFLLS